MTLFRLCSYREDSKNLACKKAALARSRTRKSSKRDEPIVASVSPVQDCLVYAIIAGEFFLCKVWSIKASFSEKLQNQIDA